MKTYVITLSQKFPKGHARAGQPTLFKDKFFFGQGMQQMPDTLFKLHTIRANYPLWQKRIEEIRAGKACLSVRQWTDKPYRSPQVEIARLTAKDGVGIQKLRSIDKDFAFYVDNEGNVLPVEITELAHNDGLSLDDWKEWFKGYDLTQPLAIIHFTQFRY